MTTAAAMAAWLVGSTFSEVDGLVAAIIAVLTLRISIQDSVTEGATQILATALGIAVALVSLRLLGDTTAAVGATVLLSLAVASALRVGEDGRVATVVTSLIVMGPGLPADTASHRAWGTLIGVAVALVASFWAHPLTPAERAERRLTGIGSRAGALLRLMAAEVRVGVDRERAASWLSEARELDREIDEARPIVETARRFARWSPWVSRAEAALVAERFIVAEHVAIQVRVLARTLFDAAHTGAPLHGSTAEPLAEALDAAASAVLAFAERDAGGRVAETVAAAASVAGRSMKSLDDTQELIFGVGVVTTLQQMADSLGQHSPAVTHASSSDERVLAASRAARLVTRPLRIGRWSRGSS